MDNRNIKNLVDTPYATRFKKESGEIVNISDFTTEQLANIGKERENYGTSLTAVKVAMVDAYSASESEARKLTSLTSTENCDFCYDKENDLVACITFRSNLKYGILKDGQIDFVQSFDSDICKKVNFPDWNSNYQVVDKIVNNVPLSLFGSSVYLPTGGDVKEHNNVSSLKEFTKIAYGDDKISDQDLLRKLISNQRKINPQTNKPGPANSPTFVSTLASLLETFERKGIYKDYIVEIKKLKKEAGVTKLSELASESNCGYLSWQKDNLVAKVTEFKKRVTRLLGMFDTPLGILRNFALIMWVPRKYLFRPCYDYRDKYGVRCSIVTKNQSDLGIDYESFVREFPKYVEPENSEEQIKLTEWLFPFTRLGYTYDVHEVDKQDINSIIGLTEFILFNGSPFQIVKTLSIEDMLDLLIDSYDDNGKIIPSNPLVQMLRNNRASQAGGASNESDEYYQKYLKYKTKYLKLMSENN